MHRFRLHASTASSMNAADNALFGSGTAFAGAALPAGLKCFRQMT
jgi:hypothetical protein